MDFRLTGKQEKLREETRAFAQNELKPRAAYWDESETFPAPMVARAAELGYLGLMIPKKYGGQELGPIEAIIAIEEMAKACANTAEVVFDCIIGPIQVIQHFVTVDKFIAPVLLASGQTPMGSGILKALVGSAPSSVSRPCSRLSASRPCRTTRTG